MPKELIHPPATMPCRVAVIWIDWYAYHVGRFLGLESAPSLRGGVTGLEMVGGVGVHQGLKFREELPSDLRVETLMPEADWRSANKWRLSTLLWQRLSALDPEVVLVPGYYTLPAVAAALWARVHRRASVLMTESTAYDHVRVPWKEMLKGIAIRMLFGWAVAGGKDHVAYLRQLGFPAERIAGFYDVVNNDLYRDGVAALRSRAASGTATATDREPADGLPKQKYFLYVGRLAEEKNIGGLLRSWIAYREQGGTWPLVLVGDGPEAAALRQLAADSVFGADVFFPGLKASRALLPFYAFAGCFVLPSTREPWGLVVNEAMSSGLPVLVSNRCGCANDLVAQGENGFVFDPASGALLTSLLLRIDQLGDAERARMGQASAERIRAYTPEKFGLAVAAIADRTHRADGQAAMQTVRGGAQ